MTKEHDQEAIWNAVSKAASYDLSGGKEVVDLDWFRENGFKTRPYSRLNWYLYHRLEDMNLRFELPYQERYYRMGKQLANRLHETGVDWWDKQLEEYQPLPHFNDLNKLWDEIIERMSNTDKTSGHTFGNVLQTQWDWRAAGNFMFAGSGAALMLLPGY